MILGQEVVRFIPARIMPFLIAICIDYPVINTYLLLVIEMDILKVKFVTNILPCFSAAEIIIELSFVFGPFSTNTRHQN